MLMASVLDRAIGRIKSLLEPRQIPPGHPHLRAISLLPRGDRILRRLSRVSDVESLRDVLAEVHSALLFAGLGFAVEVEPLGQKGPDLRVQLDEHSLLVEISRLRLKRRMPVLDLAERPLMLANLGPPLEDVRRAFQKICSKLPQLAAQPGILLIWDDDEVLDEAHVATASQWMLKHSEADSLKNVERLEFLALHVNWVRPETPQEFFTWAIRGETLGWIGEWRTKLESIGLREALDSALSRLLSA